MRQVIQSARTGRLAVREVPEPKVRAGHILVRTRASLISAGTERMLVAFAKKSLAGKAAERPDLVRKAIAKARRDGVAAAWRAATARLDEPLTLGYSAAGEIVAVGEGIEGRFAAGGRVAVAGAGVANHAEINAVPAHLAVPVPEGVADEHAAFATVGAIALHAVRNAQVTLGDVIAVIGVGLIGQLAAQLARLSGACVVALDPDPARRDLALRLGAETALDPAAGGLDERIAALGEGLGCDSVLIAAATSSDEPFRTAARIARDRARVVLVGQTGTGFPYAEFMKKELSIVASRAYGPGRYDPDYETRGMKYPEGWVRWTETANMAEALRRMTPKGGLDVASLITHRFPLADAARAYDLVAGTEPSLGVVLTYPEAVAIPKPVFPAPKARPEPGACVLGLIGAGAFARSVLIPELARIPGVVLDTVVARRGPGAEQSRETHGFRAAAADETAVLDNPGINAVVVATRHDSHARFAALALKAGKAVLVEKPLALDFEQLNEVVAARAAAPADARAFLQVGFNRRFAPLARALKEELAKRPGPKLLTLRINAGPLEPGAWAASADEGGGRIVGEACHFLDLARFLAGERIAGVFAEAAPPPRPRQLSEDALISLRFAGGSLATVAYAATGDAKAGKERIEAFAGGATLVLEDFRTLAISDHGRSETHRAAPGKGVAEELAAFVDAVRAGGPAPVDEQELIETSAAILAAMESLRTGQRVSL
ncbi:MAG: bi-domain-containing oxidoreductase [Rhodospirillales bacterium]|nr:bi-domain-containing oxidoreductase [Rhodospirillales bacterium]